ncbi:LytTR family DNA-binding domain-containing protein [Tamlana sp. 2_MG-2023]|uniref:LytR/AlgR family response regulator transcription factor n=1 Tax=unclassified Tamlana TaxID=2614803 RepID=UPI0026E121DF|nr:MULTISPECIES: LytTR family DNA-binding domain-containing protein [unclassified Tamlana]MDO6758923.1 LytTR family DNA-binding domain-containing protein [Tamlana sp. 2_MG-2023]MDO6789622.1 LytTR family DNA-binding domain-containing protein [Tamlana sp. 1_MG-2023]
MITCIIIEDQPPAQRILKKYISDVDFLTLKGVFSDAIQAIEFLKTEAIDLMFLDIHLPKISGIEFLKSSNNVPQVILTTAFSEYALESYELNVVDYLLKPFSFQRFFQAVSKVPSKEPENTSEAPKEIFIKSGYEHIKIIIDDILFIESDSDYTEIITAHKKYLSHEPLRHWIEVLPQNQFYRIHKSYILNIQKIEKLVSNLVYLQGNFKIPMGRAYKDHFTKNILKL